MNISADDLLRQFGCGDGERNDLVRFKHSLDIVRLRLRALPDIG